MRTKRSVSRPSTGKQTALQRNCSMQSAAIDHVRLDEQEQPAKGLWHFGFADRPLASIEAAKVHGFDSRTVHLQQGAALKPAGWLSHLETLSSPNSCARLPQRPTDLCSHLNP